MIVWLITYTAKLAAVALKGRFMIWSPTDLVIFRLNSQCPLLTKELKKADFSNYRNLQFLSYN